MPDHTKAMLDLAARVAWRAAGYVEPNPLVGAVLVKDGQVIGIGHHRVYGAIHAEVDAINEARHLGHDPAGATLYVTLEPCAHEGQQPPCVDAILDARIRNVVCARRDPNLVAAGGAERLRVAGVDCSFTEISSSALALSNPFVKRVSTGLPWVIAKWAQTIDGRVATRTGESQWISCEASRRRVHRLRARVDAVLTGIGTVLADDPALTARAGWHRRRVARRVVIDPELETPDGCRLLNTLDEAPLTVVCADDALMNRAARANMLTAMGVEVISLGTDGEVGIEAILRHLVTAYNATNVLVEAGPGLVGRMIDANLVDEAHVYVAPMVMGDELAKPCSRGRVTEHLADAKRFGLRRLKRIENDAWLVYRRAEVSASTS